MSVKALLKEYFGTEESKRARKLARLRAARLVDVKARIAGFLRGDESLQSFADGVRAAVEEQAPIEAGAPPTSVWGFGGPGTSLFVAALLRAAPEAKIEAELRRALAGIDTRDPSDRLRTFAAFVARAAREAQLGPESNLHVGYATCFLSFCWHALYDLEVPVFYGSSHRGAKALISGGVVADPEYASRDLAERFRAFLRITRGIQDLVRKVNPAFNFWTVESFLEWAAPRFEVTAIGSGSAMLSQVELGSLRAGGSTSSAIAAPALGAVGVMTPPPMHPPSHPPMHPPSAPPSMPPSAPPSMPPPAPPLKAAAMPPPAPPAPPLLDAVPAEVNAEELKSAEVKATDVKAGDPKVTIGSAPAEEAAFDDTRAAPRPGAARGGGGLVSGVIDMEAPTAPLAAAAPEEGRVETRKKAGPKGEPEEAPAAELNAPLVASDPGLTSTAMPLPEETAAPAASTGKAEAGAKAAKEPAPEATHEPEAITALKKGAPPLSQTPTIDLSATTTSGALPPSEAPSAQAEVTSRRIAFAPSATRRLTRPAAPEPTKEELFRALAKELRYPEKLIQDLDALLERRGQVAIEGPTGVGKTLLARRFAATFAGSAQRVRVIQLHPAFRYEDFVEGHNHAGGAGAGVGAALSLGLMGGTHHAPQGGHHAGNPGVLKAFAQRAARDPKSRYVMVLDDLGRGDVISVLGEVFSLLEFREQEVVLPISREPFSLPKNLYFIATAQATQAGRALADPALRRRFPFVALEPQVEALRGFLDENRPEMGWVADVFGELNKRLVKDAGPRAQIGQSVFMHATLDDAEVERIFLYDLRPMLESVLEASKLSRYELAALRKAVKA